MKLGRWSLHFYRLPYLREVVWSNAVERAGLFALLKLESEDGLTGVAEGTIKHTWSGVSPRSLQAAGWIAWLVSVGAGALALGEMRRLWTAG